MAFLAALGPTYTDMVLNAIFRGVVGTPPTTLYFSLGQANSTTVPAEISGITRTPVKVNRGWLSGTDSFTSQYQSGGTLANAVCMQNAVDLYLSGIAGTFANYVVMVYDAPTGGNLVVAIEPNWAQMSEVTTGDVVRLARPYSDVFSGVVSEHKYNPFLRVSSFATVQGLGSGMYSILVDWLFRGFDSMNSQFNPASLPNVYANFVNISNQTVISEIPRIGVPRATGMWSAPVAQNAGVTLERKIANLSDIVFPAATGTNTYTVVGVEFRMANVPQSFNDRIYQIYLQGVTLSIHPGDVFQFLANTLEVVWN